MTLRHPAFLLLLIPISLAILLLALRGRRVALPAAFVRIAAIGCVLTALAGPISPYAVSGRTAIFVVDRSGSIPQSAITAQARFITDALGHLALGTQAGIVAFGGQAAVVFPPGETPRDTGRIAQALLEVKKGRRYYGNGNPVEAPPAAPLRLSPDRGAAACSSPNGSPASCGDGVRGAQNGATRTREVYRVGAARGVARVTVQTPRSAQREFLSVRSSPDDPGISSDRGAFVVRGKCRIRSVERRALLMRRMISSDAASPPSDRWLGRFSVPVIPATLMLLPCQSAKFDWVRPDNSSAM